jgi:hypothetical protein
VRSHCETEPKTVLNRSRKYIPVFKSNPTLSAFQGFSKGLVRPDSLLYLEFFGVSSPGQSA